MIPQGFKHSSLFMKKNYREFILSFVLLSFALTANAEVKIGISAPLSGDLAEYGTAVRQGVELAIAEQPSEFSKINFIFEDNMYEATKAVSAFRKLQTIDRVDLIYNWGEPTLYAIAPLAEQAKMPIIAMSLDPIPAMNKKYIIRSINHAEQYVIKLLSYLRLNNLKKIAIVQTEDPFFNCLVKGLRKNLTKEENLEVVANFNPEEHDFKSSITLLKTKKFDVLGVYLQSGQVSVFYRQLATLGLKVPSFGTDFFESKTEIKDAQGQMEGAYYPNGLVPRDFANLYLQKYRNDNQIAYAYNAFTFVKLSRILFRNVDRQIDADEIIQLYSNPPNNLGFKFQENNSGGKFYEFPLVINKIVKGTFVEVN